MISIIPARTLNLVYVVLPKCGCTTVKSYLCTAEPTIDLHIDETYTSQSLQGLFARYTSKIARPRQLRDQAGMTSFTFVRDPVARLLSLHKEKVMQGLHPPLGRIGVRQGMDFDSFVSILAGVPDAEADDHFRAQSALMAEDGEVCADFVAPVERIDQVMPVLLALAGVVWQGPRFRHRQTGHRQTGHRQTGAGQSAAPVGEATLATIRRRYGEDVALHARISQAPHLSDRLPATFREALGTAGRP
jgi:hypothetical protein